MPYTAAFLIYNKLYIVYRSYELFSYVCLFSLYIHIFSTFMHVLLGLR